MNREKQILYAAEQLFEQGNVGIIETVFSSDYVAHEGDKTHKGRKFITQFIRQLRSAIPDIKILRIENLCQTENIITCQRTFSGTHKKNIRGIPASLNKVQWNEIVVTRFEGSVIAEEWIVSGLAFQLLLKQLIKNESTTA
jgi:predicted ester cyclase